MGVIKRGILGGFKNKVANIVGSSWKGIAVIKSLPLSVANPRTALQVSQRERFASINAFAKLILVPVIKPMWDRFAQRMSGINDFVSVNIVNWVSSGMLDPSAFKISKGNLTNIENMSTAVHTVGHSVDIAWDDNSGAGNALATDELYVVIYTPNGSQGAGFATGIQRSAETASVNSPFSWGNGDTIWCAASFRSADGTRVANGQTVSGVSA